MEVIEAVDTWRKMASILWSVLYINIVNKMHIPKNDRIELCSIPAAKDSFWLQTDRVLSSTGNNICLFVVVDYRRFHLLGIWRIVSWHGIIFHT